MLVGVDVGGTKIAVLIANSNGQPLHQTQTPTDAADLVQAIMAAIHATLRSAKRADAQICAIGLGIPGMVDRANGRVELATNLKIVEPLAIVAPLAAAFGCPVKLENDVRLAAMGAHQRVNIANLAYLSIGTGVAAGIVLNHQLWHGQHNMAGELGHMAIDEAGTLLEQKIAGPAIVAQAANHNLHVRYASDLFHLAARGHPVAQRIVTEVCSAVGRAIQWLTMTYDVERVVLGGGVTQAGEAFRAPLLAALARMRSQSALNRKLLLDSKIDLLPTEFNAGLHGAIQLARSTQDVKHANS